jgi:hypothetical protein
MATVMTHPNNAALINRTATCFSEAALFLRIDLIRIPPNPYGNTYANTKKNMPVSVCTGMLKTQILVLLIRF